jgi:hypothetical protein
MSFDVNVVYMADRMAERPNNDEWKDIFVGWPADGGLSVLEYRNEVGGDNVPMDIGKVRMASTMRQQIRSEILS